MRRVLKSPEAFIDGLIASLPEPDADILRQPAIHAMMSQTSREIYRQGCRGLTDDALALSGEWGFSPSDVKAKVLLWHGEEDTILLPVFGRYMERELPSCRASFLRGEGHFFYLPRWAEILEQLTY